MIKKIFDKFSKNEFLAVGIYSASSAFIRIIITLCIGKIIAGLLGPEGLALVGQLTNFSLIILVFAGTSISQGVTKYISEYNRSNPDDVPALISTSFSYYIISALTSVILLLICSPFLAEFVLLNHDYWYILCLFSLCLIFISLNNFLLAVVNGFKQFRLFNKLNIWVNIINFAVTIFLIYMFGLTGALLGVFAGQAISFIYMTLALKKQPWFNLSNFKLKVDKKILKNLSKFAALAIMSTALYPLVTMFARSVVIQEISLEAAGIYEFIMRVSSATLLFFSLAISTYYIPRLSEITTLQELKKEVYGAYKICVPIAILLLGGLYVFRNFAITVLASDKFLPASDLFLFQLIGDFFKINAQILSFILVARAKIRPAILIEIGFNVVFLSLLTIFIKKFALEGAPLAYAVSYFIYFLIFAVYYKFKIIRDFYDS